MIKYYRGDLFKWPTLEHRATLAYFAHGVNLNGVMGAGIAKGFKGLWPQMYESYRSECRLKIVKLGDARLYEVPMGDDNRYTEKIYRVVNLFTQPRPGPYADAVALALSVERMCSLVVEGEIVMPLVGSGLGGLPSDVCRRAIEMACAPYEPFIDVYIIDEFVPGLTPIPRAA